MIFQRTELRRMDESLTSSIRRVAEGFLRYLHVRLELVRSEAAQAKGRTVRMVALGAGAAFLALLGYLWLMMALTAGLAHLLPAGGWALALLIVGVLHVGGAVACALGMRRTAREGLLFPATRREIKEDQKWLTSRASTN